MSTGTIYTHEPNPRSTAILAVAKAQGAEFDVIIHDKKNKESHEQLLRVNPLGQVPVFVAANGYVLTECIPIALYITSLSDTTTLLGSSRRDYYDILKWMSLANYDLLPAIGALILPLIGDRPQVRKNTEDCLKALYTDCRTLNNQLSKSKYLIGDNLTLADLFTVGTMVHGVMVFHKLWDARYPRMMEWFREIYEMPSFKEVAGDLHLLDIPLPFPPPPEEE
ncbi:MAG: hypothetical protein Q9184_005799 [Pyrenodesmia sp. 2 TL-2023]